MYKKKQIVVKIFQGLLKLKTNIIFKNINRKDVLFLDFLWKHNIIYGYLISGFFAEHKIMLFLKYNQVMSISPIFFISKMITAKNLKRERKWAKNTFFILYTKAGFLSNIELDKCRIGGYLVGKFF